MLCIACMKFMFQSGHAISQVDTLWALMQAIQLRSEVMPSNFCGGKWSVTQDNSSVFLRISTTASYSSPSSYCSCQKDRRLKLGNFHVKQCWRTGKRNTVKTFVFQRFKQRT
jgi:hypothetical protein